MKSSILTLLIFITTVINLYAQDSEKNAHNITLGISEVALLDIESTKDKTIKFEITAPTEAGKEVNFTKTNSNIWLNYSSIVAANSTRNIGVQITAGKVPDGLLLRLYTFSDNKKGKGKMGITTNYLKEIKKSESIKVVTGIGSSYTGNGPSKGYRLFYALTKHYKKGSYSKIDSDQSNTLTITYTLSDD